jgi:Flp pilus assembly protein TadG
MGLVLMLLVTLVMGTIEFGRAWMISNMITHAARNGARAAAVTPPASRSAATIADQVKNEIANVVPSGGFSVNLAPSTVGGVQMVSVTVSGSVPYVFGLFGPSFTVNRTVTFRDEGA